MRITPTIADESKIPSLENGDQLTLDQFERRYAAMTDLKKAELIEGIVYMASPLKITQHGEPHAQIMLWLGFYQTFTSNLQLGDNCTVLAGDLKKVLDILQQGLQSQEHQDFEESRT